jgi:hypothetical protein
VRTLVIEAPSKEGIAEMLWLFLSVVLGAVVTFIVPPTIPPQFRRPITGKAIRGAGVLIVIFSTLLTSFVIVPDGHLGQLFRNYGGGSLREGRIVAVNGENGPQAEILAPGFHFRWFLNAIYTIDTNPTEVEIPADKVGVLIARDGAALRPGQAFADPFPSDIGYRMLDAVMFLRTGGQRGPQLTVLTPGRYRLNRYLWDYSERPAMELEAGFVGVVKSNVHGDVDFGPLRTSKPDTCDGLVNKDARVQRLEAPIVPVGCVGFWDKPLQPGKYYFNPDAFEVKKIDARAQLWTFAGGYKRANISLTVDAKGNVIQTQSETDVPEDGANVDRAIFVKAEGWDVPLELRVVAQVLPSEAACLVASLGDLREVQTRVLAPSIRAVVDDVVGSRFEVAEPRHDETGKAAPGTDGKPDFVAIIRPIKVLDLINQRRLIEGEIERRLRLEAVKSCITIREVHLGEAAIPPQLLVGARREQVAAQFGNAFIQEKEAQEKRAEFERAKAIADQQPILVAADTEVRRSSALRQAQLNTGVGERDRLTAIAEGELKQMDVLGIEATVRLREFELVLDRIFGFANSHPDVITAALVNAHKFAPNHLATIGVVPQGGTSLMEVAAILDDVFRQSSQVTPASRPTRPDPAQQ